MTDFSRSLIYSNMQKKVLEFPNKNINIIYNLHCDKHITNIYKTKHINNIL